MVPHQLKAYRLIFLYVIAIIGISFSAIFVKWTEAPTGMTAMARLFFAAGLLFPWVYRQRTEWHHLTRRSWLLLLASGGSLALHFICWMESLRYTSVASSTTLNAIQPVFVMIAAYLCFRIRVRGSAILIMCLALLGMIGMGWGDFRVGSHVLFGDFLAMMGALVLTVQLLAAKSLRAHLSASTYSFIVFVIAASVIACYNAIRNDLWTPMSYADIGWALALAVVSTFLGHHIFNYLLKEMNPTSVAMGVLGEPVGATVLAYFLLHETVTGLQLVSGLVILTAIALFIRQTEKVKS